MNLTIIGNHILVEVLRDVHKGGVIIPDAAQGKSNFGIVKAFGKVFHDNHPEVRKGNRCVYKPYGPYTELELNGKPHLIIPGAKEYALAFVE